MSSTATRRVVGGGLAGGLLHRRLGQLEERLQRLAAPREPERAFVCWWTTCDGGWVEHPQTGERLSPAAFDARHPFASRIEFDLHASGDDWVRPDWAEGNLSPATNIAQDARGESGDAS